MISLIPEAVAWQVIPYSGFASATLVSLALASGVFILMRRDGKETVTLMLTPGLALVLLLAVVMGLGLFASQNTSYGVSKVALYAFRSVLPVLALFCLRPFGRREARLIADSLVWASTAAALNLLAFSDVYATRVSFTSANPITVSRAIGLGAALALTYLLVARGSLGKSRRWAYTLAVPFLVAAMVLTGSRGPLVALLVAPFAMAILVGRRHPLRVGVALIIFTAAVLMAVRLVPNSSLGSVSSVSRLNRYYMSIGVNTDDVGRLQYLRTAWLGTRENWLFGVGTGDYPMLLGETGRDYPHNVVLEAWVEDGILGLFTVAGTIFLGLRILWRARAEDAVQLAGAGAIFLFGLINALFSGDIPTNFQLWIGVGLVWLLRLPRPAKRLASAAILAPAAP